MIKYVKGDLFKHLPKTQRIVIPHVCNNIGRWGSGFVTAVSEMWPLRCKFASPEFQYRRWFNDTEEDGHPYGHFALGNVQFADTGNSNITVANMIAQNGIVNKDNPKPLKYTALIQCMQKVADANDGRTIYAPKFGSALAGGTWGFIEELIEEIWCSRGLGVTIFEL